MDMVKWMSPACSVETVEDLRAEVEVDAKRAPPAGCSYKRTTKERWRTGADGIIGNRVEGKDLNRVRKTEKDESKMVD